VAHTLQAFFAAIEEGGVSTANVDQLYLEHVQTVAQRTDRALAETGFDALVVQAGGPPTLFLDDQDYPYKVNPHFKAWVPILDNPRSVLIYRPGSRPQVLFHQPSDYWHKAATLPREPWTAAVEIIPMPDPARAFEHWAKLGRVAFIGPCDAFDTAPADTVNHADLLARLHYARAVKTEYEIECMRRASALGALGHRAAAAAFRRGASEYEVHMRYLEACRQREEEMPYNNIVAYNEHGAILHYQHLDRETPAPLRSLLIDAGAQYRGYASDITRTHAASNGRFAALVDAVDRAQQNLCSEIVAGRDYREVHLTAHRVLGDVLHEVGLTRITGQEALDRGVTQVFFPHGIGHLLGLQVHDVGGVMGDAHGGELKRPEGHPYLRLTRMLEPGVVVTVEPGIYLIDSLLAAAHENSKRSLIDWSVVDELRPYGGVRIEDNVLTTVSGPENMTRNAFTALDLDAPRAPSNGVEATPPVRGEAR
jgi:Xaa-Pro dipeptidase